MGYFPAKGGAELWLIGGAHPSGFHEIDVSQGSVLDGLGCVAGQVEGHGVWMEAGKVGAVVVHLGHLVADLA